MTIPNRSIMIACLAMTSSLMIMNAYAQADRARVISNTLRPVDGDVLALNESGISIRTNQGTRDFQWTNSWGMSLLAPTNQKQLVDKIDPLNMLAFVETTDGQRLFITMLDSDDPDYLIGSMGPHRVRISLEHIKSVLRIEPVENRYPLEQSTEAEESDRVQLINGDQLIGFIVSIGSDVEIETDTDVVSVPLDQLTRIDLANPESKRDYPGLYLHTHYGLIFHTDRFSMELETAKLSMDLVSGTVEYEPDPSPTVNNSGTRWPGFDVLLSAVEIRHADRWISNPLETGNVSYNPTSDRDWTPKPYAYSFNINTIDSGSIQLLAPTSLVTEIEPGSTRLLCTARPKPGVWNNHIASIDAISPSGETTTIWSKELSGSDQPIDIDVNIPSGSAQLVFSVEAGLNGPIQDACDFEMIRVIVVDETKNPG